METRCSYNDSHSYNNMGMTIADWPAYEAAYADYTAHKFSRHSNYIIRSNRYVIDGSNTFLAKDAQTAALLQMYPNAINMYKSDRLSTTDKKFKPVTLTGSGRVNPRIFP